MNDQIVTEIKRCAMATEFAIILPGESSRATEAAMDALDLLEKIESQLSIYRPESEISCLNRAAAVRPVNVSQEVYALIERANRISELTDGAFDITAGPLVECWGFTKRRGQKPTDDQIDEAMQRVGWRHIELNPTQKTAFLRLPGMQINLGGIGKGFAIDQMAKSLKRKGVEHFLIHGGKSTILASSPSGVTESEFWRIAIEHPLRPGRRLAEIKMVDGAIATSGSGKQYFHYKGKRIGHVLDPRTGRPAGDMLSITIQTQNATDADAYSTACFVCGYHATAALVQDNHQRWSEGTAFDGPTQAIVVTEAESGGDVELHRFGDQ